MGIVSFTPDIATTITKLTTYNYKLPQGFSTSGAILNLIFVKIDEEIFRLTNKHSITYTRYGDDLSFSGEKIHPFIIDNIEKILNRYGFYLNHSKTNISSSSCTPLVTKINVESNKPKVSRKYKKNIRAQEHNLPYIEDKIIKEKEIASIQGKKQYIRYIES